MRNIVTSVPSKLAREAIKFIVHLRNSLPHLCVLCHNQTPFYHQHLCDICRQDIPFPDDICLGCAVTLTTSQPLCGLCQKTPQRYQLVTSAPYKTPLKQLISSLKYKGNSYIAHELATHLSKRVKQLLDKGYIERPHFLLPIPLHRKRLWQRGYNQANLIAIALGQELDIPVIDNLARTINTPAQTQLDAAQRQQNLTNAFKLRQPILSGPIALIDDVYTTGSTMLEVARTIEQVQSIDIQFWSIARTIIE